MPRAHRLPLVLLAVVAVAACGGGTAGSPSADTGASQPPASQPVASEPAASASTSTVCGEAPVPADAAVSVTIKGFAYAPEPVRAKVGDVIAWTNQDDAPHSATLEDGSCGTPTLATGITGALVFNVPGTYSYLCQVHPGQMKGFTIEIQ